VRTPGVRSLLGKADIAGGIKELIVPNAPFVHQRPGDIKIRVLADTKVASDPSVATSFGDQRQDFRRMLTQFVSTTT
jgi:hypothetical protein